MNCPSCSSDRTRRGGNAVWFVYLVLIAFAIVAVFVFHRNAAIVGAIMIAAVIVAHAVLRQRVCLDCGRQWRA